MNSHISNFIKLVIKMGILQKYITSNFKIKVFLDKRIKLL